MKKYFFIILFFGSLFSFSQEKINKEGFKLIKLNYSYDALEPYFDRQTMEIHHTKHHKGYVDNLNKALHGTELEGLDLEKIIEISKGTSDAIRNNSGGVYNHNFFFESIAPNAGGMPKGKLLEAINKKYGDFSKFKEVFKKESLSRFGSGWAWLILDNGDLKVLSTPNQDNPLMDKKKDQNISIIIGLDVWEHAYYLKYQNKRADYIDAFFSVIDWNRAEGIFVKSNK